MFFPRFSGCKNLTRIFRGKFGEKRLVPREKVDANATFFGQNSSPIKGFGTAGYEIQAPTGAKWHTRSQLRVYAKLAVKRAGSFF